MSNFGQCDLTFFSSRKRDLTANLFTVLHSPNLVLFSPFLPSARRETGRLVNENRKDEENRAVASPSPTLTRRLPPGHHRHRPRQTAQFHPMPIHRAVLLRKKAHGSRVPFHLFPRTAPSTLLCRLHLCLSLSPCRPAFSVRAHGHGHARVVGCGDGGRRGVHWVDSCGVLHGRGCGRGAVRRGFRTACAAGADVIEEAGGGGGGEGLRATAAAGAARRGDRAGAPNLRWVRPQETAAHGHQGPNLRRHAEQVRAF